MSSGHQVVTLEVDNERLTFYSNDWPAIQRAVNKALISKEEPAAQRGLNHHGHAHALAFRVDRYSKLTPDWNTRLFRGV